MFIYGFLYCEKLNFVSWQSPTGSYSRTQQATLYKYS